MEDAELFVLIAALDALVRKGSIRRAAASLKVSKATVSRHIQELEDRLGMRLLERTTRRHSLTPEGQLLLERFEGLRTSWQALLEDLNQQHVDIRGTIRITAPHAVLEQWLTPLLVRFTALYPKVKFTLIPTDSVLDMLEHHLDLALRIGWSDDTVYRPKTLTTTDEILVATPTLAKRWDGTPQGLQTLPWVSHGIVTPTNHPLTIHDPHQNPHTIQPQHITEVLASSTYLSLLKHGMGVGFVPKLLIQPAIDAGHLTPLPFSWRKAVVFLVLPSEQTPARVQTLVDFIAQAFHNNTINRTPEHTHPVSQKQDSQS